MQTLSASQKESIVEHLSNRLNALTVMIFGSAARGAMRTDSDVDIAYIADQQFTPYELFMVAQELAERLDREVDLVDFSQASSVFKAQIAGTGKLLLDREPVKRQYAFMRALKEYALLNEERHEILVKSGYSRG